LIISRGTARKSGWRQEREKEEPNDFSKVGTLLVVRSDFPETKEKIKSQGSTAGPFFPLSGPTNLLLGM